MKFKSNFWFRLIQPSWILTAVIATIQPGCKPEPSPPSSSNSNSSNQAESTNNGAGISTTSSDSTNGQHNSISDPVSNSAGVPDGANLEDGFVAGKSLAEKSLPTKSAPVDDPSIRTGFALLVGIDKYKRSPLSSCVADANAMKKLLMETYQFPEENILLLTDEAADKSGIMNALQNWLIPKLTSRDQAVFFFSGHGTQVHDYNGDEEDGMDEALCPANVFATIPVHADQYITDDELGNLLQQARLKAARLTAIIDSCHSGTGTRSLFDSGSANLPTKFLDIGYQEPPVPTKSAPPVERQRNTVDGIISLFACQPDQKAVGGNEGELSVFTRNVIQALSSKPDYSPSQLVASIAPQVVQTSGYYQQRPGTDTKIGEPVIQAPGVRITSRPGGFVNPPPATPAPEPETTTSSSASTSGNQSSSLYGELVSKKDFAIWIDTNKVLYCKDDLMKLTVRSQLDCFIRIYLINAASETVQIFPNAYQSSNFVQAGTEVTLPPANGGFQFRMSAPFGTETIKVVASTEQFSDLQNLQFKQGEIFRSVENLTPSTAGTKGITIEAVPPPSSNNTSSTSTTADNPTVTQGPKFAEAAIRYVVSECK